MLSSSLPVIILLSGLDPTGGAGLLADIRGASAASASIAPLVSTVTVQGKMGLTHRHSIPANIIQKQLNVIYSEFQPRAIKIGIITSTETMVMLSRFLSDNRDLISVLDPVWKASRGGVFSSNAVRTCIIKHLIPQIYVLTPNIPELSWLTGIQLDDDNSIRQAVNQILDYNCHAVLLKGGHNQGEPVDTLYRKGKSPIRFPGVRWKHEIRGTGCHLSASIAGFLANGYNLEESVGKAKSYLNQLSDNYNAKDFQISPAWYSKDGS